MSGWNDAQSADWSSVLSSRERTLWQGRPSPKIAFTANALTQSASGVVFFGFSLFWIYSASSAAFQTENSPASLFPLFGIPFALIMTRLFGKTSIKSFPIGYTTPNEIVQGAQSTIWFAEKQAPANSRNSFLTRKIGFELIEGGPAVYQLMRTVREARS